MRGPKMKGRAGLLFSVIIAACFCGVTAQTVECQKAAVADIVFLLDGSSSITLESFKEAQNFLRNIIRDLSIGSNNVQIGLAQYSDAPYKEFLLKDNTDETSLLAAVERVPQRGGGTHTGKALSFLLEQYFTKEAGSRASQRVPQIAVVITDGESSDEVAGPAQRLRQHGVIVFAIGVGKAIKERKASQMELESIANWPPNRFVLKTDSYQALQRMTEEVLKTVCISVDEQRQTLADRYADIFFLVDSNMSPTQFASFRSELIRSINQLDVGASTYRVGLAQYSQDVKVEFLLNAFKTKQETMTSIRRFRLRPQPNQPRNLGKALQYAGTHFFIPDAGGRAQHRSRQFLVVVSGGRSDDLVAREARFIESAGIIIIGMSAGATMDDIHRFASPEFAFDSVRVSLLKNIFTTEIKEVITDDCKGANLADIVFIVDESGSIGDENFRLVRAFLHSIVSGLNVTESRVRVGIVTYSEDAKAQLYLNTLKTKADILNFINILPYSGGGTNTGAALNFTREHMFTEERGSRRGVQKVVVVITDGESQDSVSEAAVLFRRTGVSIYAIGIKDANENELVQIASHPRSSHVFELNSFTKLKALKQHLQKTLCTNIIYEAVRTSRTDIKKACVEKDEADVFFLIDDSGSIQHRDFDDMKRFILEFIRFFHIGPHHVRMGLAKYADSPTLEFDLTTHSDVKSLEEAVNGTKHIGGGTETGKALSFMRPYFRRARDAPVPKYLIAITDGNSTDPVGPPAEELRRQGIKTFAIGVNNSYYPQLEEISGDPKRTFQVNNFDALKSISFSIITEICFEDACSEVLYDVIFLTDSSEFIRGEDYEKMKDFIKSVINKSNIQNVRVGVMQYSSGNQLEFGLNQYNRKDEMLQAIDRMKQMNEGTLTGKAITEVSKYFAANRGGRPDQKQRLVVITGDAQDDVKGPAEALRAKGVVIYAIGVGRTKTTQLEEISGSSERVFYQSNFDAIKDLDRQLILKLCDEDCKKTQRADIIFLVDGSGSINDTEFMSMRKFMNSVVSITTVGSNRTQFGLILYANNPNSVLTLNNCKSKQDILNAIKGAVQPNGNTYTSKALQYSLQFFNAENGGRKASKVPQILMVITDGEATDWPGLEQSSNDLRKAGVTVISIGVESENKEEQRKELEIMAGHDSSKVFSVNNFIALEALYKNISSVLCNSTKPDCRSSDVVFLLDRSSSISQDNHTVMKNFTKDLMNSFNVSKDFMHCGILQFSNNPYDEFYLNKYLTKEEIFAHIDKMVYTGGDTYLGKALYHIREYFKPSRGSRILNKIPQNLVVITDGDSHDDVEEAAEQLRDMGVTVFAIAIGDVHDLQLLQIAGTPERLFPVKNFEFGAIKTKVVSALCGNDIPVIDPTDCTIDIAMGFDISQRTGEMLTSGQNNLKILLPKIVESVSLVEDLCCLSESVKTKIAFQVVNRDGTILYDTNFDVHKPEVVEKIVTLRLSNPTYFNTALLDSFKNKFVTESKAGVKVLVIFSDGLDEDVMTLEKQAVLLRQSGISALLVVALEGARKPAELQMVEFGRGFDYKTPFSIAMPSVGSAILKQIKTVSHRECCNVPCTCSGEEGPRGPKGEPGVKGEPGQRGQPGFLGEEGLPGGRGPPGPEGLPGIQGCPGASGQKGSRGVSGNRGDEGEDGLDGINGEQGVTGRGGERGERGEPGNPGIPGFSGEPGLKGERGLRGDPGEPGRENTTPGAKGEPGNQGLPGLHGPDGRKGAAGVNGNPGPDGRRGADGEKGSPGGPGARGLPGIPGATGPQGRRGGNGELGPKGIPGFPGPQGEPGAAGGLGLPGRRGNNGQKGQPGDPGIKGAPGSEGHRGFPGEDGRDGYGPPGPPGAKGDPGFPGYPGGPGEVGFEGTKGYPGHKGNQGRNGNSGRPGESGKPGEPGHSGHRGLKGPPGERDKSTCQLITQIRENCACCTGRSVCPVYPTELVFALDMSEDVTPATFQRQRSALLSLLQNITIAESNCPTGARVAVVAYSTYTKYLIRFSDYDRKKQLMNAVENIALERTANRRLLGSAMRFVGQNIFKRIRAGVLMRKVAIFFSSGPSQDISDIVTGIMEYQALNVKPALIFMRNAPAISQALEVDDTGSAIYTVLGRQQDMAAELRKVKNCAICYDPCIRPEECLLIQDTPKPQSVNVDLVMVADSSREMQADEYTGVQELLGSVVKHLAVSQQPNQANNQARVAVVQSGTRDPKLEFGLQTYQNQNQMRSQIQKMQQQGGSSSLGKTLEYTLREVLLKARFPRRKRALMVVVGTQTAHADQVKLQYISKKAKCEGVALFVVTVGHRYSRTQVGELASEPVQQHLIHVDRLKADEQGYAQRFFRVFLSALNKGINTYPPPSIKQTCDKLTEPDETLTFMNGLGSGEPEEEFRDEAEEQLQMQTRGKTETKQLDVINTATSGNGQSSLSGANLDDPTVTLKMQPNSSPARSTDACSLSYDSGGCWNYTLKWFYDSRESRCSLFWYGGCGGNANRFETQEECENLCLSP